MMTPRARVLRAIHHQPVDRLPTQINYTGKMARKMADAFGVPVESLPDQLGNHLLRLDLTHPARYSDDGVAQFDWWGAGFDTREEGYFVCVNPLQENPDLDKFPWPDPWAPDLLEGARRQIEANAGHRFVAPNFGWALFERAWSLRGMVEFFMDMAGNPGYAAALLDRIADIQVVLAQRFVDLGVDGGYFGDDYGGQVNMLMSPKMWRMLIKPRLDRMFAPFRAAGLPILMHTDGRVEPILPDLVEIGLTVYNPVQPEVTDFVWLREAFGDRLAYYGGISTQSTMPFGTPDDVRSAVAKAARELAPYGTGLMIAPSHRMMSDVPIENVTALLDAFAALGAPNA